MKSIYIYTFLFSLISTFSFSAYYAVKPCRNHSNDEIQALLSSAKAQLITKDNQGLLIIQAEEPDLSAFCYVSDVLIKDRHLCYKLPELFVKGENLSSAIIEAYKLEPHRFIPHLYKLKVSVKDDGELDELRQMLMNEPGVSYVGYNQVFTMDLQVNDPLYPRQWSIENTGSSIQYSGTPGADMSVDAAWTITTGSDWIKVGILDSGVDTLHEDLMANLLPGFDAYATDSTNTYGYPTPNYSMDGHGTSCAGIVAAEADNGIGVAGIAYDCKIIPVRVFYYVNYGPPVGIQATTSTDGLITGASYAWRDAAADILSTSAGLPDLYISVLGIDTVLVNAELTDAYYEARDWKGIAMFFSSGNDNASSLLWPANLAKTIGIGASSMCDERKSPTSCDGENWGGNYGEKLDVVAPGVKIATTDMTGSPGFSANNYTFTFNGTSSSCPNAAGVGALILSVNPNLAAEDVRAIINITADRVPGYVYDSISPYGTYNAEMGHGRINAYAAVQLAQTYTPTVGLNQTENSDITVYPNPTNGHVNIKGGKEWAGAEYTLTDAQGKQIRKGMLDGSGNDTLFLTADTGIYFLVLSGSGSRQVLRLVKQ